MTTTSRAQQAFVYGDDDGAENAHSLDTKDANRTAQLTGTANKFILRVIIEETNSKNDSFLAGLRFSYDGGAYTDITTTSQYVRAVASGYWSDDAVSTNRITYTGTWTAGRTDSDGADTTAVGISGEYTEFVFCVYLVDGDVADGINIDFEVYDAGAAINAYNIIPRVTVSKAGSSVLVVQDGLHDHLSDNPTLDVTHILVVQDGLHDHLSDSPSLTQNIDLVAQDGLHTHLSDNPALTQKTELVVQDGLHTHLSGSPVLTQAHVIVSIDGLHVHLSEIPTLLQSHFLTIQDGLHTHLSENPEIGGSSTLVVQDGLHIHLGDVPDIVQTHVLISQDWIHTNLI